MKSVVAKCSGCGITSDKDGENRKENPVTEDGSYYDEHYVCDECYCKLIFLGRDIGTARQLQNAAALMVLVGKHTVTARGGGEVGK